MIKDVIYIYAMLMPSNANENMLIEWMEIKCALLSEYAIRGLFWVH